MAIQVSLFYVLCIFYFKFYTNHKQTKSKYRMYNFRTIIRKTKKKSKNVYLLFIFSLYFLG